MTLPTRPLGTSGLEITPVGFGAWAIGGGGWAFGWGPQDDAASLGCPVLILRGANSDVLSNQGAEEVAEIIPDSRLRTVANAGHLAAGDNPESTVGLVTAFLDEIAW